MFWVTTAVVSFMVALAISSAWSVDKELENCHYGIRIVAVLTLLSFYGGLVWYAISLHNILV